MGLPPPSIKQMTETAVLRHQHGLRLAPLIYVTLRNVTVWEEDWSVGPVCAEGLRGVAVGWV